MGTVEAVQNGSMKCMTSALVCVTCTLIAFQNVLDLPESATTGPTGLFLFCSPLHSSPSHVKRVQRGFAVVGRLHRDI